MTEGGRALDVEDVGGKLRGRPSAAARRFRARHGGRFRALDPIIVRSDDVAVAYTALEANLRKQNSRCDVGRSIVSRKLKNTNGKDKR
jgi:hypothetical protein